MSKMVKRLLPFAMGITLLGAQAWAADKLPPPLPKGLKAEVALPAPQGLTVNGAADGAALTWQSVAQASGYVVTRVMSPGATPVPVATLAKDAKGHLDKGQMAAAQYLVVAVASDGRKSAPATVTYQPKPPGTMTRTPPPPPSPQKTPASAPGATALVPAPVAAPSSPAPARQGPVAAGPALLKPPTAAMLAAPTVAAGTASVAPPPAVAKAPESAAANGAEPRVDAPMSFPRPVLPPNRGSEIRNARRVDLGTKLTSTGGAPVPFRPLQLEDIFDLRTGKPLIAPPPRASNLPTKDLRALAQHHAIRDFSIGRGGSFELLAAPGGGYNLRSKVVLPQADGSSITFPVVYLMQELNALEKGLNAHGHTQRDPRTGKLAVGKREVVVQKADMDKSLFLRQSQQLKSRTFDSPAKPWGEGEFRARQQAAMARVPVMKTVNGRPVSTSVKMGGGMLGSAPALTQKSGVFSGAAYSESRMAGALKMPPKSAAAALKNISMCPEVTVGGAGAGQWDNIAVKVAPFDATQCALSIVDREGNVQEALTPQYIANQGILMAKVPPVAKGPVLVYMKAKGNQWDGRPARYYVGDKCTLESVTPEVAMSGMRVDVELGRFEPAECAMYMVDSLGFESRATVNGEVVLVEDAKPGSQNPNDYRMRYTMVVPEFTLGKVTLQSRAVKTATMRNPGGAVSNIAVAAGALQAAEGKPNTDQVIAGVKGAAAVAGVVTGSQQAVTATEIVSRKNFRIVPTATAGDGSAPPLDYFLRDITPFRRELPIYRQTVGDPNFIATGINTDFALFSRGKDDDNIVRFEGNAVVNGYLFANGIEILGVHAKAQMPTVRTKDDNKFRASLAVSTGEMVFYEWKKVRMNDASDTPEADQCPAGQSDGAGHCCENVGTDGLCRAGVGVPVGIQAEHEFKKEIDKNVEFWYDGFFIPIIGRVGFRGDWGYKAQFAATPIQLVARVRPYVHSSVYAECMVYVFAADAGVGVDMVLANVELDAAASVYLDFGQMAIKNDFYVYADYKFLDGEIYVFIDTFSGPKWRHNLFNINDWLAQKGADVSWLKGKKYFVAPTSVPEPLLAR